MRGPSCLLDFSLIWESRYSGQEAQSAISRELQIRVLLTQLAFHPHAQQDAFRCRDARLQSRSFAGWNQSPRRSPNSNPLC